MCPSAAVQDCYTQSVILTCAPHAAARAANEVSLAAGLTPLAATRANVHPFDLERLIVNGLGGAFHHLPLHSQSLSLWQHDGP